MSPTVRISGLSRRYGTQSVLDGLDLSIAPGEFVALLGHSGSGKTTLLRILAGLEDADSGQVEAPERRAVVFQEPRLLPWKRVWRNVVLGLPDPSRARAEAALAEVGLAEKRDAWPLTLSGGEAQRAGLARALVRSPNLLLLDEPFASLDALTRLRMQDLVEGLFLARRPAVLLVTHDVAEAVRLADRVLLLEGGRIVCDESVGLPRPRSGRSDRELELAASLLDALGARRG